MLLGKNLPTPSVVSSPVRSSAITLLFLLLGRAATAHAQSDAALPASDARLREALDRTATELCAGPALFEVDGTVPGPCERVEVSGAGGPELRGMVADASVGERVASIFAVESGGVIRVGRLAVGWAPGVGAHSAEGQTTIEALDAVPGGGLELHAVFSGTAADGDMGTCDRSGRDVEVHALCSADDGTLRCVAIETTRRTFVEHELCGDVLDEDGDGDRDEPLAGEREVHRVRGFALAVSFEAGRVRFDPSPDDTARARVSGSVRAAALLRRRAMAWPDRFEPPTLTAF